LRSFTRSAASASLLLPCTPSGVPGPVEGSIASSLGGAARLVLAELGGCRASHITTRGKPSLTDRVSSTLAKSALSKSARVPTKAIVRSWSWGGHCARKESPDRRAMSLNS
jgi:hypothetical protein